MFPLSSEFRREQQEPESLGALHALSTFLVQLEPPGDAAKLDRHGLPVMVACPHGFRAGQASPSQHTLTHFSYHHCTVGPST